MFDDDECLQRYGRLREREPDWFDNPPGCPTRILLDGAEIERAVASVRAERAASGASTSDLRVGVLAEDQYIGTVVRDAVRFADGHYGLYNRVIATGGVAVLPILPGAIALIRIFRHAPRRWSVEAPQGWVEPGADVAAVARSELMEEMGAQALDIDELGHLYTSTALTSENLKLFAARIESVGAPELREGIERIEIVPLGEIDRAIADGTICDGPTISLVSRARIKGLI